MLLSAFLLMYSICQNYESKVLHNNEVTNHICHQPLPKNTVIAHGKIPQNIKLAEVFRSSTFNFFLNVTCNLQNRTKPRNSGQFPGYQSVRYCNDLL